MSVNVSGDLVVQADSEVRLRDVLHKIGLPASSLRLDITESAVMTDGIRCLSALGALRELGVQLHIDDFGTGYSPLTYLQQFAYDTLKLDKSFVASINAQR